MYDDNRWNDYLEQFTLYAVEQAGIQFGVLTGLRARRYGRDGYTDFLPEDRSYDVGRARAHLYPSGPVTLTAIDPPTRMSDAERRALHFPALERLRSLLAAFPDALKLAFFVPYHVTAQPRPGSREAIVWSECKRRVAELVSAAPHARLVDFMIASPVTSRDDNYWDPLHYRVDIAAWLARELRAAAEGPSRTEQGGYIVY